MSPIRQATEPYPSPNLNPHHRRQLAGVTRVPRSSASFRHNVEKARSLSLSLALP